METRRDFIRLIGGGLAGLYLFFHSLLVGIRWVWARSARVVLPKDTERERLIRANPADLGTRNLKMTPLENYGTMGLTGHEVILDAWRLKVGRRVRRPLSLTYSQLLDLPSIERNVLPICRDFFANHGQWKGVSLKELLQRAKVEREVTHLTARGNLRSVEEYLPPFQKHGKGCAWITGLRARIKRKRQLLRATLPTLASRLMPV